MHFILTVLCISWTCLVGNYAANILGVTFVPTHSHQTFYNSIWKDLSLRGHKVTAISTKPLRDPSLTNLSVIDVSFLNPIMVKSNLAKHLSRQYSVWKIPIFVKNMLENLMDSLLDNAKVRELIQSDAEFDVIILEVHHQLGYAFGERFKAPVIGKYRLHSIVTSV